VCAWERQSMLVIQTRMRIPKHCRHQRKFKSQWKREKQELVWLGFCRRHFKLNKSSIFLIVFSTAMPDRFPITNWRIKN
jgi:hypothetical protein